MLPEEIPSCVTELNGEAGEHILEALARLESAAKPAALTFNGMRVEAYPGDDSEILYSLWLLGRGTPLLAAEFRRLRALEHRLKTADPAWHAALTGQMRGPE